MIDTTGLSPASIMAIRAVERELEAFEAADRAAEHAAEQRERAQPKRPRKGNGSSIVFTLRLDLAELEALHRRAAASGVRPSVLARNLIRTGLRPTRDDELAHALVRLESAVAAVQAVLPAH